MSSKANAARAAAPNNYRDAYTLINATVAQQLGRTPNIQAIDTSSFVSVANLGLSCGVESLFNAMSTLIGKTIFSTRPYKGKLQVMRVLYSRWGEIIRKVVYLAIDAEATQSFNTLDSQPLQNGQSVDMYKINNPGVVQLAFNRILTLQTHVTRYKNQLDTALRNEAEFLAFWDGFMIEVMNSIESMNEARRRIVTLNAIAGTYAMGGDNVIDMAERFNTSRGSTYSRQQLLTTKFKEFMLFSTAEIKKISKAMTDRTQLYQSIIEPLETAGKHIVHHTPVPTQRLLMYAPIMTDQQTIVMPELFGPGYLDLMKYEEVNYWQNPNNPSAVSITPTILDTTTGEQKAAAAQNIPYVMAYLYDVEHMGNVEEFTETSVTPYNSAGRYWNIYYYWQFGAWLDYTEKHVLFIIGPGGAGQDDVAAVNLTGINGVEPQLSQSPELNGSLVVAVGNIPSVQVSNPVGNPVNTKEVST